MSVMFFALPSSGAFNVTVKMFTPSITLSVDKQYPAFSVYPVLLPFIKDYSKLYFLL